MGFHLMPTTNVYQVPSLHSNNDDDYKITSPYMRIRDLMIATGKYKYCSNLSGF